MGEGWKGRSGEGKIGDEIMKEGRKGRREGGSRGEKGGRRHAGWGKKGRKERWGGRDGEKAEDNE